MLAPLLAGDVIGGLVSALVGMAAGDLADAGGARIITLRRPHHPFAVLAAEGRDQQLPGCGFGGMRFPLMARCVS